MTCHLGGRPAWNEDIAAFVPDKLPPGMSVAGAANGQFGFSDCLAGGASAAVAALDDLGIAANAPALPRTEDEPYRISAFWHVAESKRQGLRRPAERRHGRGCRDRPPRRLPLRRAPEALHHPRHGDGPGQDFQHHRRSRIMAALTGKGIPQTGTTIFRPPYTPVAIGAFAGHHRGKDFARPA